MKCFRPLFLVLMIQGLAPALGRGAGTSELADEAELFRQEIEQAFGKVAYARADSGLGEHGKRYLTHG